MLLVRAAAAAVVRASLLVFRLAITTETPNACNQPILRQSDENSSFTIMQKTKSIGLGGGHGRAK